MQAKTTYVQKGNLEYAINSFPDKKVVKATMLMCPTVQETGERFCRKSVQPMIAYLCQTEGEIESIMPGITGKARCLAEDDFDAVKGEQIALCKTEIKYYQKMNRMYQQFIKKLQLTISELEKLISRNDKKIEASQQTLEYLSGESKRQVG